MFRTSIAVLLLAFATTASAEGFDYDYFDFGWGSINYDGGPDGDGFAVGGSVVVADNLHIFAGYLGADLDFGVDATSYGIGLGYNTPVSDKVDFVAGVSYEYVEFGPFDENGYGLSIGLRFAASTELEFNAGLGYVDLGDAGDDTSIGAGFLYDLSDNFAFGLSGSWSDDASVYGINGRWYFGR
jgi:hypothetical protein